MSATSRRTGATDPSTIALWVAITIVVLGVASITGAVHLGHHLSGQDTPLPANPFELVIGVARGTVAWPPAATGVLIAAGLALVILAVAAAVIWGRRTAKGSRVDRASRYMAQGRSLSALTAKGAAATATRLGVRGSPGLPIGARVPSGTTLYSSWEDVSVDIWGPRTGKTTSRAVPAIMAAPGAVIATSNKRDLLDATRDPRVGVGPVWIFDPQAIADQPATWWWNPLSYVVDEVKAGQLAKLFATSTRKPSARTDAYFDNAATSLLANLLLAAAVAGRPITDVYLWLTDPTNDEPATLLRQHGHVLPAAAVEGIVTAPDKQRAGVYGSAQETVSFLTGRAAARWVTPNGPGDPRPQFDPAAFVASADTLYLLSKEGEASSGPLVTALTVAVTEAAEHLAKRSPGGRLATPLVAVLDEAANVCRWHALPDQYSHYGSRGITVMTILQSWSQGVEVWGREGMRKLWSAANIKVYGGGVSETEFLGELSQLVGDFEMDTTSTSHGKGGRTRSLSTRREQVLSVADLAHLPRGRAVLIASGAPATLVRTLPWMAGPHAAAVAASIRAHDPAAAATLHASLEVLENLNTTRRQRQLGGQAREAPGTSQQAQSPGSAPVNPWLAGGAP